MEEDTSVASGDCPQAQFGLQGIGWSEKAPCRARARRVALPSSSAESIKQSS